MTTRRSTYQLSKPLRITGRLRLVTMLRGNGSNRRAYPTKRVELRLESENGHNAVISRAAARILRAAGVPWGTE